MSDVAESVDGGARRETGILGGTNAGDAFDGLVPI